MDDEKTRVTAELRTFWTRPTLEQARDELVMVPACPAAWEDSIQDAQLGEWLKLIDDPLFVSEQLRVALDYGCGVGRTTRALARHGLLVYAVDVSPDMLRYCRRYLSAYPDSVRFYLSDGWGCPDVLDRSCDLAITMYCIQHLPSREMQTAVLADCARVLRPGGYLLMQTTDHGLDELPGGVGMIGARVTEDGAQRLAEENGLVFCKRHNFPPHQTMTVARKPHSST